MERRAFLKRAGIGSIAFASVPALQQALSTPVWASGSTEVRWDILSLDTSTTPATLRAGGVAFASAEPGLKIKLTGSGTFVAPASGGTAGAVTGGGTWETFESAESTGRGTYTATGLVSWQFANFQSPGLIDAIDAAHPRANGNAVLRVQYSDGKEGVLALGCEGPGAPEGIQEGVIATKSFFTYWTREAPVAGVDKDRTLFHVLR